MIKFASQENQDSDNDGQLTIPKRVITDAADITPDELSRIHKRVMTMSDADKIPSALRQIIAEECFAVVRGDNWHDFGMSLKRRIEEVGLDLEGNLPK